MQPAKAIRSVVVHRVEADCALFPALCIFIRQLLYLKRTHTPTPTLELDPSYRRVGNCLEKEQKYATKKTRQVAINFLVGVLV